VFCQAVFLLILALAVPLGSQTDSSSEMLTAHAAVRAEVRVAPLEWSSRLAAHAKRWAQTLIAQNRFEHEQHLQYGQNLFEMSGGTASAHEVVRFWAQEKRYYNPHTDACSGPCGHYLQMVWKNTTSIGCASADANGRQVWVCDYYPPGNVAGEHPY
jgi:uncharacterized protein YkwD